MKSRNWKFMNQTFWKGLKLFWVLLFPLKVCRLYQSPIYVVFHKKMVNKLFNCDIHQDMFKARHVILHNANRNWFDHMMIPFNSNWSRCETKSFSNPFMWFLIVSHIGVWESFFMSAIAKCRSPGRGERGLASPVLSWSWGGLELLGCLSDASDDGPAISGLRVRGWAEPNFWRFWLSPSWALSPFSEKSPVSKPKENLGNSCKNHHDFNIKLKLTHAFTLIFEACSEFVPCGRTQF